MCVSTHILNFVCCFQIIVNVNSRFVFIPKSTISNYIYYIMKYNTENVPKPETAYGRENALSLGVHSLHRPF